MARFVHIILVFVLGFYFIPKSTMACNHNGHSKITLTDQANEFKMLDDHSCCKDQNSDNQDNDCNGPCDGNCNCSFTMSFFVLNTIGNNSLPVLKPAFLTNLYTNRPQQGFHSIWQPPKIS